MPETRSNPPNKKRTRGQRGGGSGVRERLEDENEDLATDFGESRNLAGYCRNQFVRLSVRDQHRNFEPLCPPNLRVQGSRNRSPDASLGV
ncbi:hypothetical protein TNCV_1338501 [Trichonephila clavipes]|nr:hypothetical protein TNCV_1338501 [Trichonephila clavipes]